MEQSLFVAAVICIVVFVGVAVAVLLQLRRTLRSAEVFFESTDATLKQTLENVAGAATKLDRVAGRIEDNTEGLERLFKGFGSVAGYLGKLRESMHGSSRAAAGRVEPSEAPKRGADA